MARGYPDFQGPKVGVYLQPEWAAQEGKDKNFGVAGSPKTYGQSIVTSYVVPAGRELVITDFSFYVVANAAADGDSNQMGITLLLDNDTNVGTIGGNGGGGKSLRKPIVIAAGHKFWLSCFCHTNHATSLGVFAQGYERSL